MINSNLVDYTTGRVRHDTAAGITLTTRIHKCRFHSSSVRRYCRPVYVAGPRGAPSGRANWARRTVMNGCNTAKRERWAVGCESRIDMRIQPLYMTGYSASRGRESMRRLPVALWVAAIALVLSGKEKQSAGHGKLYLEYGRPTAAQRASPQRWQRSQQASALYLDWRSAGVLWAGKLPNTSPQI
jgi:hypothetical protein